MPSCRKEGPAGSPGGADIVASVVSHGQGDEVLRLVRELAGLGEPSLRCVAVTLNLPEPALRSGLQARADWPFEVLCIENSVPAGFAANHNRAFAVVSQRSRMPGFFAVVNPDIHLETNPFGALLRVLLQDERAGGAYPTQQDRRGQKQDFERRVPTPGRLLRRHVLRRRMEVSDGEVADWVNAAFLLVRGTAYAQIGGFDEAFRMYCEDVDFCLRLQLAGWALVHADGATVGHEAQRASGRNLRHLRWHVTSLLRLWRSPVLRDWRVRNPASGLARRSPG